MLSLRRRSLSRVIFIASCAFVVRWLFFSSASPSSSNAATAHEIREHNFLERARKDKSLNVQRHRFLQARMGRDERDELMGDIIRNGADDYWERFQLPYILNKDTSSMDTQHVVGAIDQLLSLNGWVAALCPTLTRPFGQHKHENAYDDLVREDHLYYVAIVIHSADHFLVDQLAVIVQMAKRLGTHNLFVSMLDYDSSDSTETLTDLCEAVLTLLGVPFRIRRVPGMTEDPAAAYYPLEEAHMRNLALEPLHELYQKRGIRFQRVIWLKGFTCPNDILETIKISFVNEAAMVCGMDWAEHNGFFIFSDRWRTRDIDGDQFRQSKSSSKAEAVPPRDRMGATRYAQHLPFQVFCCESGTHVVDPEQSYYKGIAYRAGTDFHNLSRAEVVPTRDPDASCLDSSQAWFCRDLWVRSARDAMDEVDKVNNHNHPLARRDVPPEVEVAARDAMGVPAQRQQPAAAAVDADANAGSDYDAMPEEDEEVEEEPLTDPVHLSIPNSNFRPARILVNPRCPTTYAGVSHTQLALDLFGTGEGESSQAGVGKYVLEDWEGAPESFVCQEQRYVVVVEDFGLLITNIKSSPCQSNGFFDSKVLSRQHAEVWAENDKCLIRDVKSSNGTFLNGERLSQEGLESEPFELKSDDILEFGIDIFGEDNKTIIHHKVAARVACIFNEQQAAIAARAEQQQQQQQQQQNQGFTPSPLLGQSGPAFNFAPGAAQARRPLVPHQQALGSMGGSIRPPGKSGLSFDHILVRLQGELAKSRDTGHELATLSGAMNDIQDTLGGSLLPNPPPYLHALPPVRPASQLPTQADIPAPVTNPDNGPALADLQSQLQTTQSSLHDHVDKVRALEGVFADQEALKEQVRTLRELVGVLQQDARHDDDDDEGELLDDDDSDARSIATIIPHTLERVDEEDEEDLEEYENKDTSEALDEFGHDDERAQRQAELGRPRTPEPTNMGMSRRSTSQRPLEASGLSIDELTARLGQLSCQLESALAMSSTLQAQHAAAQSTIVSLEDKVKRLEGLVVSIAAGKDESSKDQPTPPESVTAALASFKNSLQGQWTTVQEEWALERERLKRTRDEWEREIRGAVGERVAAHNSFVGPSGLYFNGGLWECRGRTATTTTKSQSGAVAAQLDG
ncbi:Glycosyltransferase family 69 protein [Mycena kentingensis (nom. inval.)]|nr:Glycosyltransferase family 69 protein [Mycena kentingensis (nom. inval.)]